MYVKSILMEGFKSYRDSTRIGPFDPHFNAITGLNGSGKSNILDGICFVLGISSMSVVRCKNLSDCIYMGHGESLNKAMVSIVLDNTDKTKSPPGQQSYDEIVVSRVVHRNGECKYYINRTTATKRGVMDLFESVQLNVNNPNFMIMQGKITKVVNMKPKEVLHMIEEAVGATLYQAKRDKAENELKSKKLTVKSIEDLVSDHIQPSLLKQTKAHEMIQEYNILTKEKNEKLRTHAVCHFFELQAQGKKAQESLDSILVLDAKDDENAEQYKRDIKQLKQREEQMKQENTTKFKDKVEKTEKALQEQKKTLHAKETDVKTATEGVAQAKKAVKDAEKAKQAEVKQVEDYKKKSAKALDEFKALQEEKKHAETELEKAREQENQLRSGKILDDEGKSVDVEQELNRITSEMAEVKPELEDGRKRMAECKGKLGQLEGQLKKTPSDDQVERDFKEKHQTFEHLKREAVKLNINADESVLDIRNNLHEANRRQTAFTRERANITHANFNLSFSYDKSRVPSDDVYGCVYDYLKMNDLDKWSAALEAAIGGFLNQVLVKTDAAGKALLKFGGLQRRLTVHPLNIFVSRHRQSNVTQRQLDQTFGPGKAIFALNLLEYDNEFKDVVETFCGNKVLCENMDIARKIAFEMNLRAYTVAGDTVDPGGIMKGGAQRSAGRLIKDCAQMYDLNRKLEELDREINAMERKLETASRQEKFVQQLEKAKRELHNADQMRKLTKYSQLKQEIEALQARVKEDGEQIQILEARYKNLDKQRAQYQKKADQAESLREKNIRDNANLIQKWQKAFDTAQKKFDGNQTHFKDIEIDLNSREDFLNGLQKDIDDAVSAVNNCEGKLEKAREALQAFKEHFAVFQDAYDTALAESNEWFAESKRIQEQIKVLDGKKEASEINKMKRNNQRDEFQGAVEFATKELHVLQDKFKDVDFANEERPARGKNASALKREIEAQAKKLEDMQQRLDHDAAAALPTTKREFEDALNKLKMIDKNKIGLEKAIDTLDKSKKLKVRTAYEDVNKKFNAMMSTLLPEARAKLVEVTPGDLSNGVNIHVQLGGVWKESLTELSGGQRSLVALSLVLSLCMYNPAPFYILDEVDAALDLSHTQNIGVVIQRQFKGTQFICVSLKDGMFSNANVLFTAKHEGGRSVVTRSAKINRGMPPPSTDEERRQKKKGN